MKISQELFEQWRERVATANLDSYGFYHNPDTGCMCTIGHFIDLHPALEWSESGDDWRIREQHRDWRLSSVEQWYQIIEMPQKLVRQIVETNDASVRGHATREDVLKLVDEARAYLVADPA